MNDAAQETDVAKQRALYSQMNDLLLDESFVAFVAPTTGSSYIARREGQSIACTAHESPWHTQTWSA